MNARRGDGLTDLKAWLSRSISPPRDHFFDACAMAPEAINAAKQGFDLDQDYPAYLLLQHGRTLRHLSPEQQRVLEGIHTSYPLNAAHLQIQETTERYHLIKTLLDDTVTVTASERGFPHRPHRSDRHPPGRRVLDLLCATVSDLSGHLRLGYRADGLHRLPVLRTEAAGLRKPCRAECSTDLLAEGIVPGIGGVVIFIPQIAILFGFIALLEESGYMARVVFLMDKIMRKVRS